MGAPANVEPERLRELHIKLATRPKVEKGGAEKKSEEGRSRRQSSTFSANEKPPGTRRAVFCWGGLCGAVRHGQFLRPILQFTKVKSPITNRKQGACMSTKSHHWADELPEYKDAIHELKVYDNHFAKLLDAYQDCVKQIRRIEDEIEAASDFFLEDLKKRRLDMKDQMVGMLVRV